MARKKSNKGGASLSAPTPKTENQKHFINSVLSQDMVVGLGPAGTGKSYLSATLAAYLLKQRDFDKIVLTRPTVPTGRSIGFFPGTLNEKMEPWVKPIMVTLEEYLGKGDVECLIKNGKIEVVPFETIRGRSFGNSVIILDEAQNTTVDEIKAFVTRIGDRSKMIINGDVSQSDLSRSFNGLSLIVDMVRNSRSLHKFVPVIEFTSKDIVRSGLCQLWVEEFETQTPPMFHESNTPDFLRTEQQTRKKQTGSDHPRVSLD